MDIQLLSNEVSALAQTITEKSSLSPMLYKLGEAYPNVSKHLVRVSCNSNAAFGGQMTYQIPRYGLVAQCVMKTRIVLSGSGGRNPTQIAADDIARGLGLVLFDKIRLSSHSKEIQQLTPLSQAAWFTSLSMEQQTALEKMCHIQSVHMGERADYVYTSHGVSTTTTSGATTIGVSSNIIDVYTPLPFSFSDSPDKFFDSSFLETVEITANVTARSNVINANTAAHYGQSHIDTSNSELLIFYYTLDNPTTKKLQSSQFNLSSGKPLSLLYSNCYEETVLRTQSVANNTATALPVTLDLSCKNVVYEILVGLRKVEANIPHDIRNFQEIDEIELVASGRSIYKISGNESIYLESALLGQHRGRNLLAAGSAMYHDIPVYKLRFGVENSALSKVSGMFSLKGASAPQLKIKWTNRVGDARTYDIVVVENLYSVISMSGQDGRISSGLQI